ncbi:MAG: hypothetical protein KJ000_26560 [Pirellulaceae bacterium]|nr:hypothetical protein [Pirellulaceae bacterium]
MPINQRPRSRRDGIVARILRLQTQISDTHRYRLACILLVLLAGLAWVAPCRAQAVDAGGNPESRADAVRAIPLEELNEASRQKLRPILEKPSLYRRMPVQVIGCDPDLHVFLIRYPEVIVNIWQLMEVTKVQVKRTGPYTFDATDGSGTISKVELIYGRPDLHIFYATGYYEGPLFRNRIEGDCVILLRSVYAQRDGRVQVTNCLDVFVRMEKAGADILLKTLHPLMGKTADFNFVETAKFIGQVSLAAENNGPGIERLANRLENVDVAIRDSFARHAEVAHQRAILRQNVQTTDSPLQLQSRSDTSGSNGLLR